MAGPIRIAVLANGAQARRELDTTARSTGRFGTALAKLARVAALGLAAGLAGAAYAAKKFAESAADDQTQAALLARQLKASAGATDLQVASTERWITAQGKALGVADDELRPALSKLVTATEDISKAQGLASLAMDVAAARGKSLETVSVAIAKAQDGQVTGLSRLGVNTKNAAGETLKFTDLVKRMQDQFGGAAATKADTLQGRLDRLKVRFTEAGEAIGAKLLPPLADLAERGIDGVNALSKFARINIVPKLREASDWYKANADDLADLASTIGSNAGPLLVDLAGILGDLTVEVVRVAGPLAKQLLPAIGSLADLAGRAASGLAALPGPVRTFAAGVGIASLALPILTARLGLATGALRTGVSGFALWTAAATTASTRSTAFGLAALKMGGLAKSAAGPAGIGALILASQQGDSALGLLASAAGGAALGFSVGGPWGAIIGGAAGTIIPALKQIRSSSDDVGGSMDAAKPKVRDFAATLDQVTAASTGATRALALQSLQERGALEAGTTLGLSQRTLIDAVLGRKDAQHQLQAAIVANTNAEAVQADVSAAYYSSLGGVRLKLSETGKVTLENASAADTLRNSIAVLTPQLRSQAKETRSNAIATADLVQLFPQLKKGAIAKIRTLGTEASVADVLKLNRTLKLTPRDLRTALRVSGAVDSERAASRVVRRLQDIGKVNPKPDLAGGVTASANKAKGAADKGAANVAEAFERRMNRIKAEMPQLPGSVQKATGAGVGPARTGGSGIGSALKTGFDSGFAGATAYWSAAVQNAVHAAIRAGRAAARAHSPSEATADLGRDMADGLVLGLERRKKKTRDGFIAHVRDLLLGVAGSEAIGSALGKLEDLIRKRIDLKDDKAEARLEKQVLARIAKREKALRGLGRQQDALQSGNYLGYLKQGSALFNQLTLAGVHNLTEARDLLTQLREQSDSYAASVKQAFVDFANISTLGQTASGKVTTASVLADLRKRAEQALRFAALIRQLAASGLNATALQQLIAAGPEATDVAAAIAAGGAAAVSEVNNLQAQIAAAGGSLGSQMASQFYDAGIQGAAGMVAGLEAQKDELEKVARRMANQLVKAVKEALGIKSPSVVFAALGTQSGRGLVAGLRAEEVYVKRQGERVAKALLTGYGSPALRTYVTTGGAFAVNHRVQVEARVSSDGIHELQRGREVVADATAYRSVGGRGAPGGTL